MIARLVGEVVEINDRSVLLDVSGVGYGVLVANDLSGSLSIDQQATLYIYEHVREQEHTLYGFRSRADKQLFESLLSVNGVGPKAALAIFDLGPADKIRAEIGAGNIAFLVQASGVGKKAAERVVVDLQDKLADASIEFRAGSGNNDEAVDGLLALGYSKDQAVQMLRGTDGTTETRIKQALKAAQ